VRVLAVIVVGAAIEIVVLPVTPTAPRLRPRLGSAFPTPGMGWPEWLSTRLDPLPDTTSPTLSLIDSCRRRAFYSNFVSESTSQNSHGLLHKLSKSGHGTRASGSCPVRLTLRHAARLTFADWETSLGTAAEASFEYPLSAPVSSTTVVT
jgi:hypothetical protein